MKRSILFAGVLLLLSGPTAAQQMVIQKTPQDSLATAPAANTLSVETLDRRESGIDTLRRIDTLDSELVTLRDGGKGGDIVLEVGGFGLKLGNAYSTKAWKELKRSRFWISMFTDFEFGFTRLTGTDYAGYAPEEQGFLDQQLGPSFHFAFSILSFNTPLNKSRTLTLSLGLDYRLENLRLSDASITVDNRGGQLVPVALEEPAAKSKIVYSYLGIPLQLTYTPAKRFRLAATLHNDLLLGADAIYKKPKEKHGVGGFNDYQFGVGATISYYGFGLFMRYNPTSLFRSGAGPDCRTVTFGLTYSLTL